MRAALALGLGGVAAAGLAHVLADAELAAPYLVAWAVWSFVAIGALGLLVTHHVVDAAWSRSLVYPVVGICRTLPLAALGFLPVLFVLSDLYAWSASPAAVPDVVAAKAAWLNAPFFTGRAVAFLAVFAGLAMLLAHPHRRRHGVGALGAIAFAVAGSFAAMDWLMSLEPGFTSSNYGLHVLSHGVLGALAVAIIAVLLAKGSLRLDPAGEPPNTPVMSALLLGVLMLWAYFTFMSFLVIWSGNVPHLVAWWELRASGGWGWVLAVVAVGGGVVPFALLLNARVRNTERALLAVCVVLLAGRILHTAWLILPVFAPGAATVFAAAALVAGLGGLWLAAFLRLRPRPAEVRDG